MGKFRRKDTATAQQDLRLLPEEIFTGRHHALCNKVMKLQKMNNITEEIPDHSTFTVFRSWLPVEGFDGAQADVLPSLREHRLLRGRKMGIHASVIEANASLSGLERRNSEESYREYVRGLAADAGVDVSDPAAVARFDRSRADRRTSNREWHNPDDPDARVGRTKSGACDMIYKPEHIVDLESGAVISAEIRHGDEGDTAGLADRVAEAAGKVEAIHGGEHDAGRFRVLELAADKGYHDRIELLAEGKASLSLMVMHAVTAHGQHAIGHRAEIDSPPRCSGHLTVQMIPTQLAGRGYFRGCLSKIETTKHQRIRRRD